jgi:hypothetical protein
MGGVVDGPGNVQQPLPSNPELDPCAPAFCLTKAYPSPLRLSLNSRNQITPVAEFNIYADSIAAARVFALTSANPSITMPPVPPVPPGKQSTDPPPPYLEPYPAGLSTALRLTLFPLGK